MAETTEERKAQREAARQEREAFRAKMEVDYQTADLPLKARDLIWKAAWEHGHAYGFQEVEMFYDDMADIAKAAKSSPDPAGFDPEDDALDGILFRFWIRAASYPGGWPGRLSELFREHGPKGGENVQPRHYRAALMALAKEKGVNLPGVADG